MGQKPFNHQDSGYWTEFSAVNYSNETAIFKYMISAIKQRKSVTATSLKVVMLNVKINQMWAIKHSLW